MTTFSYFMGSKMSQTILTFDSKLKRYIYIPIQYLSERIIGGEKGLGFMHNFIYPMEVRKMLIRQ